MKMKQWLREYKNMTYAEYKALPDMEQYEVWHEHRRFCRSEQMRANRAKQGWKPMTEEMKKELDRVLEAERIRYETSLKIGGIDSNGNYTALHYR